MKKLLKKITAVFLLMLLFTTSNCYGASGEEYVRIRIRSPRMYNEQSFLEGYENITVYELKGSPNELFQLDAREISILQDSYYDRNFNYTSNSNNAEYGPNHVILNDTYSSYKDANREVEQLEKRFAADFYPQLSTGGFKIYGGNYASLNEASVLLKDLNSAGYAGKTVNEDLKNIVVYDEKDNVIFMYSNELNIFFSSFNRGESCEMIKIDKKPYRGLMGFKIVENSKLASINYVDLESYLYGVVPNEIAASWGKEALKAQAVAARTYAVASLKPNAAYGYDMDDNQNSQVYMGYNSEKDSTNVAVDETIGEMIYYDNKLIEAFYHSTSGGRTENSENVWSAKLPYAVGVDDEYSNRSGSPYIEWQKTYTKEEIIKMLRDDGNNVRELYSIEITKLSENNRVMECIFNTDIGQIVYRKENARLLLGLMSSWFTIGNGSVNTTASQSGDIFYFTEQYTPTPPKDGILESITGTESKISDGTYSGSLNGKYVITDSGTEKLSDGKISAISSSGVSMLDTNMSTGTSSSATVSASGSNYTFKGRGWGHGVGMSQYGAKEMAEEGFTYDEILKHYYTGVTIK